MTMSDRCPNDPDTPERLVDLEDLIDLRLARTQSGDEPSLTLEEVKRELGLLPTQP
jgi:hypothetical protein